MTHLSLQHFDNQTTIQLVEDCKRGERKAQAELYKQYAKAMYSLCLRITNDADEAEDVLQEAFLTIFSRLDSFRGEASFGAWIKRIVVNTAINSIQKKRLDTTSFEKQGDFLYEKAENNSEADEKELIFQVEKVKKAVRQLPDGFRMVLSLYLFEGYDHVEIAQILGITESTSKSQYNRAKKKLLEIIKS